MSDRQRNLFVLLLVAGLLIASAVVIATKPTKLGLDLQGGVELVYQVKPRAGQPPPSPDTIQRTIDVMRERVDQLGVAEPEIQQSGGEPDQRRAARRLQPRRGDQAGRHRRPAGLL